MSQQASQSQPTTPHSITGAVGIPSQESVGRPAVLTTYPHWQYFLALERDLIETTYYVEPASENFRTFSVAYARLLLTAGSEIDVLCKLLCHQINPATKAGGIDDYRQEITARFPQLPMMRVLVPRYALVQEPWAAWCQQKTPEWWHLHQKVKHERHAYYHAANLENSLQAVAALFCLVLYHYQPALYAGELVPWAQFFGLEQEPEHVMSEANYKLPDF